MSHSMTLEEKIGQLLMIGVPGGEATPGLIRHFRDLHAGALIVYRPNFISAQQFKALLSGLEQGAGQRLLVAVDHEGGRVIHLAEGVTVFPDNLVLGNTGRSEYAFQQGELEAAELRRLGIDLNLAPTIDVLTETYSPNIGIRSYSKDHALAGELGASRIRGLQSKGLSACAKHFPGQGHSPLDSHLQLPVLGTTWEEMREIHMEPFVRAIEAGVDTVMSSHPIYLNLDPEKQPATFSKTIIGKFLREELGFQGVILSDDLEMGALKGLCSIGESAVRAIEAGHDMVLICHDLEAQKEVFQALRQAYREGRLSVDELDKSVERIRQLKQKRSLRFEGGEPRAEKDGFLLAEKIARGGIAAENLSSLSGEKVLAVFPRLSTLSSLIHIEKACLNEAPFVKELLEKNGAEVETAEIIDLDPSQNQIDQVLTLAKKVSSVVYFCYDAHLNPGCKRLLEKLQTFNRQERNGGSLAVVFMRDPYDADFLEAHIPFVNACGFRAVQLAVAVRTLSSCFQTAGSRL